MMVEVFRVILITFFRLFYRVNIKGLENVPDSGGAVLCSNHIGELDMFVIGYRVKRLVHWMAKEELFRIPILTSFIKWLGAFPVKRGKADVEAIKTAIRLVNEGNIVGIFPEGTRMGKKKNKNKNKKPKVSRSALMIAEKCNVPIIPVAIKTSTDSYRIFSRINVVFGTPINVKNENQNINIIEKIYSLLEEK